MIPEQRYLFDVTGYLHLKNVLSAEELKAAARRGKRIHQYPYRRTPTRI